MDKILIVDDDKQSILYLRSLLADLGYHSDFIANPELLPAKLEQETFDLLLLDVYMPGIDGISLLKALKSCENRQDIAVIMLTSAMEEQLLAECLELGADNFIRKPVSALVLKACIQSALTKRDYLRQINAQKRNLENQTLQLQTMNTSLQKSLKQLCETQEQLVETEKMAALGGLVAGIAHEVNTPVGIGVTAASFLAMKVKEYEKLYLSGQLTQAAFESFLRTALESSEMIVANLSRAADIIRGFKQIANDQSTEELRRFRLEPYLKDIITSLQPMLKQGKHQFFLDCPEELELFSYPGKISQVITNLVMNSLTHAFTKRRHGEIRIICAPHRNGILLIYKDNGEGIPSALMDKIFQPFFTTRRGQGGTGLGLHIVHSLVFQALGGQIECKSQAGEWTLFRVWLPNKELKLDWQKNKGNFHVE